VNLLESLTVFELRRLRVELLSEQAEILEADDWIGDEQLDIVQVSLARVEAELERRRFS